MQSASRRGRHAGRVVYTDVDIRLSPRKDVCASPPFSANEHALQRLGVPGTVGVLRDTLKESLRVADVPRIKTCCDEKLGESR